MYFRHYFTNKCVSQLCNLGISVVQQYVKIESFRGSAPNPAGGAYSAPPGQRGAYSAPPGPLAGEEGGRLPGA